MTEDAAEVELLAGRLWSGGRRERRRALRRLLKARTPSSVRVLVREAARGLLASNDRKVARDVRRRIIDPGDQSLVDAVWESVLATGARFLAETVAKSGPEYSGVPTRAAVALLAGDVERYRTLDPTGSALREIHEDLGEPACNGLAESARAAACTEWVEALITGRSSDRFGTLVDSEWLAIVEILREKEQWEVLWRLTFAAPPVWAGRILHALGEAGWEPADQAEGRAYGRLRDRLRASRAVRPEGWVPADSTVLPGLSGRVRRVVVTPDGRQVCVSTDSAVQLWRLPSTGPRTISRESLTAGRMLAVAPGGSLLVGDYTEVRTWPHEDGPKTIARTWDLPSGADAAVVTAPMDSVNGIVLTADGGHLVAGDRTGAVHVSEMPSGRTVGMLPGDGKAVSCVAASGNGDVIASGHVDGTVRVWSRVSGHVRTLRLRHMISSVAIPAGGGILATSDGRITAWDLPGLPLTLGMTPRIIGNAPGPILTTPDGKLLAADGLDGVQTWQLATGEFHRLLPNQGRRPTRFAILGDGRFLAGSGSDGVHLWGLPDGDVVGTLTTADESRIEDVAADKDGTTIVTAGESVVVWRLWDERVRALSRCPLAEIAPADIQRIRSRRSTLLAGERAWLDLITELVRCRDESE